MPLERYLIAPTTDRAAAHSSLERVFGSHHLAITEGDQPDIRLHSCQLASVMLSYLSLGASTQVDLSAARSRYLVQVPLAGSIYVRTRDEFLLATPTRVAVLPPDEPASIRCSAGCGQLIVGLDKNSLQAHTRGLLHAPLDQALRFDLAMDIASGAARDWYESLMALVRLADRQEGLLRHPLVAADMERALMTGLLVAQPNTYSRLLSTRAGDEDRSPTEIAIALIDMHPERDYTVASLAQLVGVSARTLEKGFLRRVGLPPNSYLRHVRLERVREELTVMTGGDKKVSEVAARWGIYHFGRFARDYFGKYHEMPSETVRRSRSSALPDTSGG